MRVTTLLLLAVITLPSCNRRTRTEQPEAAPEPTPLQLPPRDAMPRSPMSDLKPIPAQPESVLINAGSLPLVHLFDQGGRVRILNATSRQTLLDTTVRPGAIISVSDSGILVGRERRLTTRLDPKHRYEIVWDTPRTR